jgi:hypothetical protein
VEDLNAQGIVTSWAPGVASIRAPYLETIIGAETHRSCNAECNAHGISDSAVPPPRSPPFTFHLSPLTFHLSPFDALYACSGQASHFSLALVR